MALLSGLLAGGALLVLLARPGGQRLGAVLRPSPAGPASPGLPASPEARAAPPPDGQVRRRLPEVGPAGACLLAAVAAAVLLPSPGGLVVAVPLAVAGPRLLDRLEPRAAREEREQLARDAPLMLDLLASCLAGGAPPGAAARAVAAAVPGPAGRRLLGVAASLAVGVPPSEAWLALAGTRPDDPLAPAARALARAAEGGAPVATAVSRLAAETRAAARSRGEQAARRVGVLAVAPLGLCFLPAFVLLGVVPVVIGLAGPLLRAL